MYVWIYFYKSAVDTSACPITNDPHAIDMANKNIKDLLFNFSSGGFGFILNIISNSMDYKWKSIFKIIRTEL